MSESNAPGRSWRTKPTDRFVLRFIKVHLSARVTPLLVRFSWLSPWMITVGSTVLGVLAGSAYAVEQGFVGGVLAGVSPILDGVDGQFARLTGRASRAGAFLDSVLDRYADGALVIGLALYVHGVESWVPTWVCGGLGFLALAGSGLISYTSARAESLGIDFGAPTLASKGTRTTMIALSGLLSPLWAHGPFCALVYLVVHTNSVVLYRIFRAQSGAAPEGS